MMYGTMSLLFVGAGSLVAGAAARRYGVKGLLAVWVAAAPLAVLVNGVQGVVFHSTWHDGSAVEMLAYWAVVLLVLYSLVRWLGRSARASAAPAPTDAEVIEESADSR